MNESRTGEIISSKSINLDEPTRKTSASKGPITTAAINEESTYLLTVGENKILRVWRLPNLESVNERCFKFYLITNFHWFNLSGSYRNGLQDWLLQGIRRPSLFLINSAMCLGMCCFPFFQLNSNFSKWNSTNSFSYALSYDSPMEKPVRDEFSSHENPSDGQLILGHVSPLNAFLLSHDEKYIITADRDEHIRVSWYPQGYNIEMYCLGHRR